MLPRPQPDPHAARAAGSAPRRRWVLFVHHLPASPSNLRVRTWRRLQQLGAVSVKQAVYALPDSPTAREDFEWLRAEVKEAGGDATVFVAESVDTWADDALVEEFRRSRQDAYADLAREVQQVMARSTATRRRRGARRPAVGRLIAGFRERLAALDRIDFFGSAGRDAVATLLARLEEETAAGSSSGAGDAPNARDPRVYTGRVWVTRPRPGVDRMSSAWLIRRFVDPAARFGFAPDRERLPSADAVPFDMFGVEFSHHGDECTFETLCRVFAIQEPAIARLAAVVHDLDLKDGRFGAPEAPTIGAVIEGLQLATADDDELLARGMTMFESLYLAFAQAARPPGPRRVAAARPRHARGGGALSRSKSRRPR